MTNKLVNTSAKVAFARLTPLAAALLVLPSAGLSASPYGVESNEGLSVYAAAERDDEFIEAPKPQRPSSLLMQLPSVPSPVAPKSVNQPSPSSAVIPPTIAEPARVIEPAKPADKVVVDAPAAATSIAATPTKDLDSVDTVGTRLGWLTTAQIAQLPDADKPPLDATCQGAWATPVPLSTPLGDLDTSDIEALANSLSYNDEGGADLSGSVRITQGGRLLEADSGSITQDRNFGRFDGNVRIAQPGVLLTGEQAVVNINTSAGQLLSSEFVSQAMHAHGRADRMRRFSDGTLLIDRGIYTTCAPGSRVWSFEAKDIELNPNTGIGEVYSAKLRIQDVPILYLPYFRFPIDDRRQTGILIPRFGNTNDGGFDLSVPIYLNIAPQLDATVTPRLLSSRGAMLETETRYLTHDFGSGELKAAILPGDQKTGEDRKSASLDQRADWQNGWRARTSLNYVSDNFYFTDLGTDLNLANQTHQERLGEVFYDTPDWHFVARAQGFQTIDPDLLDVDKPYSRVPQFLVTSERERLPGWQRSMRAEVARFERNIDDGSAPEVNGTRIRLDPEVRFDYSQPWGYLRPAAKLSHLSYALDGNGVTGNEDTSLTVPTLSLDTGLIFERFSNNGSSQVLEPRLYYLYAPNRDQSSLPNFDSAVTTFSYDQLFRDTRFSGGDRIDDANQVAIGLTSRWLDADGFERLQASLGQIVYLRDREVRLDPAVAVDTSPASSYAGNMTFRANEETSFFADLLMDSEGSRLSQYSVGASYLPKTGDRLYNAGYRFRRDDPSIGQKAVSQTQLSFVQPLGVNWKVLGLWNYDIKEKESQEALFGVSYEACCWQVRLFKRSFIADAAANNSPTSDRSREAIFIEIVLKGLAGFGTNVDTLFEKNVFGYNQLDHKKEGF
ncbi:MAG: LPS assembly protein LptD [Paraperlucidibaca sp.]|nr:LPS assembly protein LptD [Paraperlucidibaca sp.]